MQSHCKKKKNDTAFLCNIKVWSQIALNYLEILHVYSSNVKKWPNKILKEWLRDTLLTQN